MPMGVITFTFIITLLATGAGLLITFLLALPILWLLFTVHTGSPPSSAHASSR